MKHLHHRRRHRLVYRGNRNPHLQLVRTENQVQVASAMYEAPAVIQVTTKKLRLGNTYIRCIWIFFIWKFNNILYVKILSISKYPQNYQDHINPPARFSDSNDKSKAQTSPRVRANQKLQREAFQINV